MSLNALLGQKSSQFRLPAPTMGFKLNLPKPSFKIDWKGQVVPVTSAPGDGSGVDPYNLGIAQLQGPLDQATIDAGDRQNAYDQSKADLLAQLTAQRDAPPEQNPGDILQPKEAGIAALVTALAALGGARLPYIQAGLQGYVGGKKTLADMKYSNKYRAWQTAMQDIDRLTQAKQFDYTSKANDLNRAESKRLGLIGQMTGLRKEQIAAQKEQERTDRAIRIAGIGANSRENVAQINHQGEDPKYWMGMGFSPEKAMQYAASAKTKNLAQEQSALAIAGWFGARPGLEQQNIDIRAMDAETRRKAQEDIQNYRQWHIDHPNEANPYAKALQQALINLSVTGMQDDATARAQMRGLTFNPITGFSVPDQTEVSGDVRRELIQQISELLSGRGQGDVPALPNVAPGSAGKDFYGPIAPMRIGGNVKLVPSKALGGGAKKKSAAPLAPKKKVAGSNVAKGKSGATLKW